MSRTARCTSCAETFDVDTDTGPLPSKCDTCDPAAAERRATQREQGRRWAAARAAELLALRRRVAELEHAVSAGRPERPNPTVPASRTTVTVAVRRAGTAEGARQTAQRLRELAAEAMAWADSLAVHRETDPSEHLEDIAA